MHNTRLFIFFLCLLFKTIESSGPITVPITDKISVSFLMHPRSKSLLQELADWSNGDKGDNGDKKLKPGEYRGRTDEELLRDKRKLIRKRDRYRAQNRDNYWDDYGRYGDDWGYAKFKLKSFFSRKDNRGYGEDCWNYTENGGHWDYTEGCWDYTEGDHTKSISKALKESVSSAFSRAELYAEYRVSEKSKISVKIPVTAFSRVKLYTEYRVSEEIKISAHMTRDRAFRLKIQVGE